MYQIKIFVRNLEGHVVRCQRLLLEVFRQSVVLFGESSSEIKVSLAFEDRFSLSSKIITGETLATNAFNLNEGTWTLYPGNPCEGNAVTLKPF